MTCDDVRELMLTADMQELLLSAEGGIGEHTRSCNACQRVAATILVRMRELDAALITLSETGKRRQPVAPPTAGFTAPSWLAARPLLAAAAALVLLVTGWVSVHREMGRRAGDRYPLYLPPIEATVGVVNAGPGSAVVLMRTSNPKISVVWYLKSAKGRS